MTQDDKTPDTEVQPKARRRTFSASDKHRILAEADQCQRGRNIGTHPLIGAPANVDAQHLLGFGLGMVALMLDLDSIGERNNGPLPVPDTAWNGWAFTGEWRSANETQYHRARHLSPGLGVWLSMDPFEGMIDRPMSLNGYAWVEGQFPNATDPAGKASLAPLNLTSLDNVGIAMTLNGGLCSVSSAGGSSSPIRTGGGIGTPNLGSSFDGVCCLNLIVGAICFTDCPDVPWPLPNPFYKPVDPQDVLQETIDLIDQVGHFVIDSFLNFIDPFGFYPRSEEIVQAINDLLHGPVEYRLTGFDAKIGTLAEHLAKLLEHDVAGYPPSDPNPQGDPDGGWCRTIRRVIQEIDGAGYSTNQLNRDLERAGFAGSKWQSIIDAVRLVKELGLCDDHWGNFDGGSLAAS